MIPDTARAWERGDSVRIRRPDSVRTWQHVLESLCGYLVLAERLAADSNLADVYNFGPEGQDFAAVRSLLECARRTYPDARIDFEAFDDAPHARMSASEVAARTGLSRTAARRHLLTHSDSEVILNLFADGLARQASPAGESDGKLSFDEICTAVKDLR